MSTPLFSLIVPIYNVEGLLRDCICSIERQLFCSYEIVAIEDCSTDTSGRIIRELAERNNKIKVVELDNNLGLANARNEGLLHAKGEYVVFIDSDDEIESELLIYLSQIVSGNDVVVFNHYREWANGRRQRNLRTDLLNQLSGRPILKEHINDKIKLFSNLNVAWNKVYRRKFLIESSISFDDGYYEDVAFNYKCIVLAEKILVTPYLGYKYRQRTGSILNSRSDKHKDLTKQYAHLYSFIFEGDHALFYQKVDEVFVCHLFNLLVKQSSRLTKKAESILIKESNQLLRKYNVGKRVSGSSSSLKFKYLYLLSSRICFNGLAVVYKAKLNVIHFLKAIYTPALRNIKTKISMSIKHFLYKFIFIYFPISEKAVFESYWGKSYSCNPKEISEYLIDNTSIRTVWFGKKEFMDVGRSEYYEINSFNYFYHLATAKYFISNANFPNFVKKRKSTVFLQTKHGTPLKLMGFDELRRKNKSIGWFDGLSTRSSRWDFIISSNKYSTETWKKSFPFTYKTLEYGYPRNDFVVNNANNQTLINDIKEKLGVNSSTQKKLLLFMPTHREFHEVPEFYLNIESFISELSENYILLTRAHYFNKVEFTSSQSVSLAESAVIDVSEYGRVEELYLMADVLITDYSSSMFDFGVLKKPIILYMPDYDEYEEKRGMYFDIRNTPPGIVAYSQDELVDTVKTGSYCDLSSLALLEQFYQKFCSFDDGNATEKVCKTFLD